MLCTLQASPRQAGPGDSADEGEEEHRFYGYNQMCYIPRRPRYGHTGSTITTRRPDPARASPRSSTCSRPGSSNGPDRERSSPPARQTGRPGRTNDRPGLPEPGSTGHPPPRAQNARIWT
jgi:hypothetical protein